MLKLFAAAALVLAFLTTPAGARTYSYTPHSYVHSHVPHAYAARATPTRSPRQRAAFMRTHPCPATGRTSGACPGYVVDHIYPLCAGGLDAPSNMQWQQRAASYAKDKQERALCRNRR